MLLGLAAAAVPAMLLGRPLLERRRRMRGLRQKQQQQAAAAAGQKRGQSQGQGPPPRGGTGQEGAASSGFSGSVGISSCCGGEAAGSGANGRGVEGGYANNFGGGDPYPYQEGSAAASSSAIMTTTTMTQQHEEEEDAAERRPSEQSTTFGGGGDRGVHAHGDGDSAASVSDVRFLFVHHSFFHVLFWRGGVVATGDRSDTLTIE